MPRGMTKCPRRWSHRFGVITLKLATGERLPVIIEGETGIPLTLALRWALTMRRQVSSTTLASYLRRIAELYEWHYRQGIDFDDFIRAGKPVDLTVIGRALDDVDRGLDGDTDPKPDPAISGHIQPDETTHDPEAKEKARRKPVMHNLRLDLWCQFLKWVLRQDYWRTGARRPASEAQRAARVDFEADIDEFSNDEREPTPDGGRRPGLSDLELEAIESVIAPDGQGRFRDDVFSPETTPRVWALYLLGRYGGLRIGEKLNMHLEDIPTPASGLNEVEILRRMDDADDPRLIAPSVKRGDRTVVVPRDVVDELNHFIREHRGASKWPDLFLSTTEDMPLSYSRAADIAVQLRDYAQAEFERRNPGVPHTLDTFTWHRLRHTRAREVLPLLVDLDSPSLTGVADFLRMFGWAREESAKPYIEDVRQERIHVRLERAFENDRVHHLTGDDDEFPR